MMAFITHSQLTLTTLARLEMTNVYLLHHNTSRLFLGVSRTIILGGKAAMKCKAQVIRR